ncbi:MAG: hypothetical protein KC445_03890 [Anaerolineales bacterium]|nr:hypothetical protein [Anaerolineales bacterium]
MNHDNTWQSAVTTIPVWLRSQFPDDVPLEIQVSRFLVHFSEALDQLKGQLLTETRLTRPELALLFALMYFGPQAEPALWEQRVQQLLKLSPSGDLTSDEACLDLAIAYGCGWHQESSTGSGNRSGRWHRAIVALRTLVEASLHQTFKLIVPLLPHPYFLFSGSIKEGGRFYSDVIALELAHNRCRCGKHRQGCQKKGGGYACGQACCREEHQLSRWEPAVCSLQAFVAHSIRGNASSQLKTGAFTTSMLYPLINADSGVTVDSVEFKICGSCSETAVLQTIALHKEPPSQGSLMYEGNSCPECDIPANRATTYHKARKNWILIPYEFGGAYEMLDRWRCPRCRNLFPVNLAICPLCSTATPQRKTTIWVYSPLGRPLDGEEDAQ